MAEQHIFSGFDLDKNQCSRLLADIKSDNINLSEMIPVISGNDTKALHQKVLSRQLFTSLTENVSSVVRQIP